MLAYLLIFSRVFLLATRQGYLPRALAELNQAGTPRRAILTQSAMIACAAVLLFVIVPTLLRLFLSADLVDALFSGDQYGLVTSLPGSLWCGFLALLFGFALWLCWKKRRRTQLTHLQRLLLSLLCVASGLSSLVCMVAPLLPGWPVLFFSHNRWFALVLLGIVGSLVLAWGSSELPRRSALVREKARSLAREKELREELQRAYEELDRLYQEQAQAALTDTVTGLLNHWAFMQQLDEAIARGQTERSGFLLVFLDVDHFKAINDTWGHLAGDAVLRQVAERLRTALHAGDVASRYGGDEFALILDNVPITRAHEEGERLRRIIQSPPYSGPGLGEPTAEVSVTTSIGVAAYGIHGTQANRLIDQADQVTDLETRLPSGTLPLNFVSCVPLSQAG
ncbi:hypothetical protein KSC_096320 [Ktedonobacter sp. SOSP1-52]|uniref:diguanylate cyclase domain-containing protein n=1 Tax=Ktedonobacter sp. SOSP1-52 TaxID=2778366 RepID=UPI0019157AEC|nr:diguanylate cyclase [Ktedonobacter sp. SOSP1-52]GHO70740.1 hypothetical protein KSC_096320 [Ktedonobacter sp. SOSP1-52]